MEEFTTKRLAAEHIPAVAAIEKDTFNSPWSEEALRLCISDAGVGFVALDSGGHVAAYVTALLAPFEIQIINVATRADMQRRGLAARALGALSEYARGIGAQQISLEVRESNAAAIGLYEKLGFSRAGVRKNFYSLPREDGIVMILTLTSDL